MTQQVITANRLNDGLVVFLASDGCWADSILDAQVLSDDTELDKRLTMANAAEQAKIIVGPYAIEVTEAEDGDVRPVRFRERIRAYGPSTHADFARQDVPGHLRHLDDVSPVYFNGVG
ncbi:MAG: DUF2849 domain-containing protein [Rhodospirillales bacterium]|nr:DUF2849 domain-containing protein [Rhodospirillales bacterium]